jgi:hypothetical protein
LSSLIFSITLLELERGQAVAVSPCRQKLEGGRRHSRAVGGGACGGGRLLKSRGAITAASLAACAFSS